MSWNWKTLCRVRDQLKDGYRDGVWIGSAKDYSVSAGYEWLRAKHQKLGWTNLVWNKFCTPKHNFLAWLVFKNALNVKEKLFRHGISRDATCCVCGTGTESVPHLFQQCRYYCSIISGVCDALHVPVPPINAVIWIGRRKWSQVKKSVCLCAILAVYYHVWQQRNLARLEGTLLGPTGIVSLVGGLIKLCLSKSPPRNITQEDLNWINSITFI